jgi:predicted RNase H-like nuclease (RuvC/YqgF family)
VKAESMELRLANQAKAVAALSEENQKLRREIGELKRDNDDLRREVEAVRKLLAEREKKSGTPAPEGRKAPEGGRPEGTK